MSRRMWTGILAGVLGAMVLVGVAAGAYRIGRGHDTVRTVGDGEAVRMVGHGWGHGGGYGAGPGFFLFPLLLFGLVALLIWAFRSGGGRPWGDGPWGGGPWARGGPEGAFSEWHRRAHSGEQAGATPSAPASPPPGPEPGKAGPGEAGPPPTTV